MTETPPIPERKTGVDPETGAAATEPDELEIAKAVAGKEGENDDA